MDFYDKLKSVKGFKNLGWKEIGDIVDMKPDAIRVAVERKSLDKFKIKEIEKYYDLEQLDIDYSSDEITISLDSGIFNREGDMNKLARFFLRHQDELREDLLMGRIIKDFEKKGENKFLKAAIEKLKADSSEKANWVREYLLTINV